MHFALSTRQLVSCQLNLMFMTMSRYRFAHRCQSDMVSALHHYVLAGMESREHLYFAAVVGSQFHLAALVALLIQPDVGKIYSLLFGQRGVGQAQAHGYLVGE